jgi:hypothetical protein
MSRRTSFVRACAGIGLLLAAAPSTWIGLLLAAAPSTAEPAPDAPPELGTVRWERDFAVALESARRSHRPALVLFQEVPGCSTCVGFGQGALSHPLLVEVAETDFVPVAVLNTRGGADRQVLRRYGEPAWNNPVVRFLGADGSDLIPRRDGVYTERGLAARMAAALEAGGRPVPPAHDGIDDDARSPVERTAFVTHCFWEGEACLGGEPGVRATRAAWHEGREAVEVWYDPAVLDLAGLMRRARERGCADAVIVRDEAERQLASQAFGRSVHVSRTPPRPAPESDQKRHLRRTPLASLPLTHLQRTRINAALARGDDPSPWLTPRQRARVAAAR